jgi:hypothetical protein
VRMARRRKPSAAGHLIRTSVPLPEDQGPLHQHAGRHQARLGLDQPPPTDPERSAA